MRELLIGGGLGLLLGPGLLVLIGILIWRYGQDPEDRR